MRTSHHCPNQPKIRLLTDTQDGGTSMVSISLQIGSTSAGEAVDMAIFCAARVRLTTCGKLGSSPRSMSTCGQSELGVMLSDATARLEVLGSARNRSAGSWQPSCTYARVGGFGCVMDCLRVIPDQDETF